MAPSLAYMERAYFDAKLSRLVARADRRDADPVDRRRFARAARACTWRASSASTRTRASATCCPGRTWDDASRRSRRPDDRRRSTPSRPNFARSVLGRRVLSPLDLEREFGLIGGDIFHGALSLDQLFSARPGARQRRLPDADQGSLPVRLRRASGRRRHRDSGPQRRARDPEGRGKARPTPHAA